MPRGWREWLIDGGIAAALIGAMLVELALCTRPDSAFDLPSVLAIVAAGAPVLWRRRHPAAALAGCAFFLFGVMLTSSIYMTIPLPSMVAGYSLALVAPRRQVVIAGVALVPVVISAIVLFSPHGLLNTDTPKNLVFVATPLLLGCTIRERRLHLDALTDRAETAERTREQEALRRVEQERLRIAREVHDVVAHAMVAINVQSGVAGHLLDSDTEQARRALRQIKHVSGEALGDLRSTLGVLRDESERAPSRPVAGLDAVEELAGTLRAAGLDVRLDLDPGPALPSAVDAAGYRIVQEALTNVLRHAGAREVSVRATRDDEHLRLLVCDDGAGLDAAAATAGSGNGLRGMRERAAALGGWVQAGPGDDGTGWQVRAELPLVAGAVLPG